MGNCLAFGVGNYLTPPLGNCLALEALRLGNYLALDSIAVRAEIGRMFPFTGGLHGEAVVASKKGPGDRSGRKFAVSRGTTNSIESVPG